MYKSNTYYLLDKYDIFGENFLIYSIVPSIIDLVVIFHN